jgi:multicomponent K+:H+ antiporter subunit D
MRYLIVVPLVAGASMLLLADTRRYTRATISLISGVLQLA